MRTCFSLLLLPTFLNAEPPSGAAQIRAQVADSALVLTTTTRCAGAVHSLTWRGKEFIDSADHGRQLQSALNADFGTPILNETYNPTEAGSLLDGAGAKSSSRLLHFRSGPNWLQSTSQMAFWLAPGQKSGPNLAKNTSVLSDYLLTKRITLGNPELPNVIPYEVTFQVPLGEPNHLITFESLTGYMPAEFSKFWKYEAATKTLVGLDDGPGEQSQPIVFATPDGKYAMGIYSPEPHASYGRFRFGAERVVKWNTVFRVHAPPGETVPAANYTYRHRVIVGDLEMVTSALRVLAR